MPNPKGLQDQISKAGLPWSVAQIQIRRVHSPDRACQMPVYPTAATVPGQVEINPRHLSRVVVAFMVPTCRTCFAEAVLAGDSSHLSASAVR